MITLFSKNYAHNGATVIECVSVTAVERFWNWQWIASGFNGLPAGYRDLGLGNYNGIDDFTFFWSLSDSGSTYAWCRAPWLFPYGVYSWISLGGMGYLFGT